MVLLTPFALSDAGARPVETEVTAEPAAKPTTEVPGPSAPELAPIRPLSWEWPLPKVICPRCGDRIPVKRSGEITSHRGADRKRLCEGSGYPVRRHNVCYRKRIGRRARARSLWNTGPLPFHFLRTRSVFSLFNLEQDTKFSTSALAGHLRMKGGIHSSRLEEHRAYTEGLRSRIRAILQEQWDPIRVYQHRVPHAQPAMIEPPEDPFHWLDREYDCYINTIEHMLNAGFSCDELVRMLNYWAGEHMLSPNPPGQDEMTAAALRAIPPQKDWEALPGWRPRSR